MKNRLYLCFILISTLQLEAQTNQKVRLAVVAETDQASAAADVMTAQLSGNSQIVLLERNEIEKIYREQELSAGNRDYLQLGHILGADGLLLLETQTEGTTKILDIRLIAVTTGVLLASERFSISNSGLSDWAAGFARHLEPLLPKLKVSLHDAVPISVVNLRAAFQTPEEREAERNLTLLTIHRLVQEQQVFVLERRRMQSLSLEKEFAPLDDRAFWNGSFLLEGTIDRDGYSAEKVTLSARLVPPQGRAPISMELVGSRTNLAELAVKLTSQILNSLQVIPGGTAWNPTEEARQFEAEARWALRWHLYEAAQSASESAWALGDHSRDVAALRIRSYSDSLGAIDEHSGNIIFPAVPDASQLKPCIRALSLYCEDSPLAWSNTNTPDFDWFDAGVKSLERAASVLDSFYHAAELRTSNEELLAELRDSARRLLTEMDKQAKTVGEYRKQFKGGRPVPKGVPFDTRAIRNFDRLGLIEWEQGGLCYEKAAEALPLYHKMVEAGYFPDTLPRIVGWSWEDRKTVPLVIKQFVGYVCASTNEETRFTGLYFSFLCTPNDGTGRLKVAEDKWLAALWERRTHLVADEEGSDMLARTLRVLEDKHGDWNLGPFNLEPWANFRRRLREFCVTEGTNWSSTVCANLFYDNSGPMAKDEAEALLPKVEALAQNSPRDQVYAALLKKIAGLAEVPLPDSALTTPNRAGPLPQPAAKPLVIHFTPWNLETKFAHPELIPQLQRLILRDGKLWGIICFVQTYMSPPHNSPMCFFSADAGTGHFEEIVFPEELGFPGPGFDVTSDSLFVSLQNKLACYHRAEKTWETIPLPTETDGAVLAMNGRVYFANRDGLLEIDPRTRSNQTLVSSRRVPPASILDSAWGESFQIFVAWGGRLGAYSDDRLSLFDLEKRVWENIELPKNSLRSETAYYVSAAGIGRSTISDFYSRGLFRRRLVGFSPVRPGPELLLEQNSGALPPGSGVDTQLRQPRWQWPEPFPLEFSSFVLEGENLWSLLPRSERPWFGIGGMSSEPVQFSDDRNATLLRFGPRLREALSVPIRFDREGRACDPCDLKPGSPLPSGKTPMDRIVPIWMVSDQGILVSSLDEKRGHWLIPRSVLDQRWEAFQKSKEEEIKRFARPQ